MMKLVDSHCHLHLIDLALFDHDMNKVFKQAQLKGVEHFLCVSVDLEAYPKLCQLAETYSEVSISVGVHPNHGESTVPTFEALMKLAEHPACIAIGETGLDFFRVTETEERMKQRDCFSIHIQTAKKTQKPLIIHTREAAADTLSQLKNEKAETVGGVMHCFTESWDVAVAAMDLGFYISFSGIVTFKNALALQDVAKKMPLEKILIETDSPYLAPAPFRGTQNHPALVYRVAEVLAELRGASVAEIAEATTTNFYRCFPGAKR